MKKEIILYDKKFNGYKLEVPLEYRYINIDGIKRGINDFYNITNKRIDNKLNELVNTVDHFIPLNSFILNVIEKNFELLDNVERVKDIYIDDCFNGNPDIRKTLKGEIASQYVVMKLLKYDLIKTKEIFKNIKIDLLKIILN